MIEIRKALGRRALRLPRALSLILARKRLKLAYSQCDVTRYVFYADVKTSSGEEESCRTKVSPRSKRNGPKSNSISKPNRQDTETAKTSASYVFYVHVNVYASSTWRRWACTAPSFIDHPWIQDLPIVCNAYLSVWPYVSYVFYVYVIPPNQRER